MTRRFDGADALCINVIYYCVNRDTSRRLEHAKVSWAKKGGGVRLAHPVLPVLLIMLRRHNRPVCAADSDRIPFPVRAGCVVLICDAPGSIGRFLPTPCVP